jgi:hypothetical protein
MNEPEMNEPGIGHNEPPAIYSDAEYQQHVIAVTKLMDDADAMFTGVEVETEEQYETVKNLQDELKAERLAVERQRKIDKQPFLDLNARIDGDYKAISSKLVAAEAAGKTCVEAYLREKERIKAEKARIAREEAEAAEKALQEAHAAKEGASLEEELELQELEDAKKKAVKASGRANKKTATGLKTVHTPTITDKVAVIKHYWSTPALMDTLMTLIHQDIRAGKADSIPGIEITTTREAR